MRRLLNRWMSRGGALLAVALLLGCAPADKPKVEPEKSAVEPVTDGAATTDTPASDGVTEDATPEQDAATEAAAEEKAAGGDELGNGAAAPTENLDVPPDPVNLK